MNEKKQIKKIKRLIAKLENTDYGVRFNIIAYIPNDGLRPEKLLSEFIEFDAINWKALSKGNEFGILVNYNDDLHLMPIFKNYSQILDHLQGYYNENCKKISVTQVACDPASEKPSFIIHSFKRKDLCTQETIRLIDQQFFPWVGSKKKFCTPADSVSHSIQILANAFIEKPIQEKYPELISFELTDKTMRKLKDNEDCIRINKNYPFLKTFLGWPIQYAPRLDNAIITVKENDIADHYIIHLKDLISLRYDMSNDMQYTVEIRGHRQTYTIPFPNKESKEITYDTLGKIITLCAFS